MSAPFKTWTVLPHGAVQEINPRIRTVTGKLQMPLVDFERRMTVVRLTDGRLVVYSAVSLDEAEMHALEAWGVPSFLIVPSERHRLDAPSWKARYPAMQVVAPAGSRKAVAEVVPVDVSDVDFGDPTVRLHEVRGTGGHECALTVEAQDGVTLIVNEVIAHMHETGGVKGMLLKGMGFQGEEAKVPMGPRMQFKKGLPELAAQFRSWADRPNLTRIIVSHGDIIETDPAGTLRRLADELDR